MAGAPRAGPAPGAAGTGGGGGTGPAGAGRGAGLCAGPASRAVRPRVVLRTHSCRRARQQHGPADGEQDPPGHRGTSRAPPIAVAPHPRVPFRHDFCRLSPTLTGCELLRAGRTEGILPTRAIRPCTRTQRAIAGRRPQRARPLPSWSRGSGGLAGRMHVPPESLQIRRVQQPGQYLFFYSPGCDRARCHRSLSRRHRPAGRAAAPRAGRPPRSVPPEHRHRRGDRAARRGRRLGRAPSWCAFPAAASALACPRRRLRAAVLRTAHAPGRDRAGKAPWLTTAYWILRSSPARPRKNSSSARSARLAVPVSGAHRLVCQVASDQILITVCRYHYSEPTACPKRLVRGVLLFRKASCLNQSSPAGSGPARGIGAKRELSLIARR